MNISNEEQYRIWLKAIRNRLYPGKEKELEEADKEDLFYENLDLKSEVETLKASQQVTSKLTLIDDDGKYITLQFTNSNDEKLIDKVKKDTSQFNLLVYFIAKRGIPFKTTSLVRLLEPEKRHKNDMKSSARVNNFISDIRGKFGKEIIVTVDGAYMFTAKLED